MFDSLEDVLAVASQGSEHHTASTMQQDLMAVTRRPIMYQLKLCLDIAPQALPVDICGGISVSRVCS